MSEKKKKGIQVKKLKYPLWLDITFTILTVVAPIILIVVQGLTSPSRTFRFSFTVICSLLLSWIFIKKFIIKPKEDKLIKEKVNLEHDYSIDVGDPKKCKFLWITNELWLTLFNVIQTALFGLTILLLAVGIESANIKVKFSSFLVIIFYLLAFGMKIIYLLAKKEALEEKEEEETEETKEEEKEKEETKEEEGTEEEKPGKIKIRNKRGE